MLRCEPCVVVTLARTTMTYAPAQQVAADVDVKIGRCMFSCVLPKLHKSQPFPCIKTFAALNVHTPHNATGQPLCPSEFRSLEFLRLGS